MNHPEAPGGEEAMRWRIGSSGSAPELQARAGWLIFWLKYLDQLIASAAHVANSAGVSSYRGCQRG